MGSEYSYRIAYELLDWPHYSLNCGKYRQNMGVMGDISINFPMSKTHTATHTLALLSLAKGRYPAKIFDS